MGGLPKERGFTLLVGRLTLSANANTHTLECAHTVYVAPHIDVYTLANADSRKKVCLSPDYFPPPIMTRLI